MKRRVLVGQALVHRPPVIILDEPTAGVDVELRQGLWKFIRELNVAGHTIVLTTHYLEEAEALCARIAMLKQGRIVALDTTRNLLQHVSGARLRLRLEPDALHHRLRALQRRDEGWEPDPAAARLCQCGGSARRSARITHTGAGNGSDAGGSGGRVRADDEKALMPSFLTLLQKELLRFWKVSFQTIAAPILTALLYLLIFSHALASHVQVYPGVSYTAFSSPAWQ